MLLLRQAVRIHMSGGGGGGGGGGNEHKGDVQLAVNLLH